MRMTTEKQTKTADVAARGRVVLVGTYRGDQLKDWPGWYCWPLDAGESHAKSAKTGRDAPTARPQATSELVTNYDESPEWLPRVTELWLYRGTADERRYRAEFVGVKTREELIHDYGYPGGDVSATKNAKDAKGGSRLSRPPKPHGTHYALFKTELLYRHKNDLPGEADAVIVRIRDFARSPKVRKQLREYLESPDRNDPDLAKRLPDIITKLRPEQLHVCEAAVQLSLFPEIDSFPQSSVKEVSKPVEAMSFSLVHHLDSIDQRKREYPSISLFSGAMGLDIGLGQSGIDIRIGQDFDRSCVETMLANRHPSLCGDIRGLSPDQLLEAARLKVGETFLLCGGPPCQPFSTAGKRLGINDPRGSLFMEFIRMIDAIRPRFFVMENVKGLMSAPLRTENGLNTACKGSVLDVILDEFSKLNYKTVYGVLDAVNYGVPQFRERFILLGSRDGEDVFLPIPTHFQRHQNPLYRWRTLGDAIKDLEDEPGFHHLFSEKRARFLKLVPPGGNWRSLPSELLREAMGGAYESGGGKVGFYRRLSYAEPCPTVTTSPAQKATMLCHPTRLRTLSIPEYKRIQQFPDDWVLTGSPADQYRQIGNAVPIGLAKAIGDAIIATATNSADIPTKRFRGTGVHARIKQALTIGEASNDEI